MKRWGIITLMVFAFVAGFASTYNCGGGSTASGAGDADTLQGHPASDFALSIHGHSGYATTSMLASHTHSEYMEAVNTCSPNQVLKWNGSIWVCSDDLDSTDADTLDSLNSTDFALSSHSHASSSGTQYLSFSFLGGTDAWPWGPTGKVTNIWEPIAGDFDQFANADTSISWVGRSAAYAASSGQKCPVYIPVQLPNGAIIVKFGMLYYDETDGSQQIEAYLQQTIGNPKGLRITGIKPSTSSFQPQYAWTTTIDPNRAVIDNITSSYHIRGNLWGAENMALMSAFVGYKMP